MAIDTRQRDKSGEISRRHGNALIRMLRNTYGQSFAEGCSDNEKLGDVLHKLDESSLTRLIDDHDAGIVSKRLRAAHALGDGQEPESAR